MGKKLKSNDAGEARIAKTEVCDSEACRTGHLLVRGDRLSFVSVEQVKKVGRHKLDAEQMPSDVVLPQDYVLVHDTAGSLLSPCELFVVRWHKGDTKLALPNESQVVTDARKYFGGSLPLQIGEVDTPDGPWHRVAKVAFIRYFRAGNSSGMYEHEYDTPVLLHYTTKPLAWKLALPNGCIVDSRGFVRP